MKVYTPTFKGSLPHSKEQKDNRLVDFISNVITDFSKNAYFVDRSSYDFFTVIEYLFETLRRKTAKSIKGWLDIEPEKCRYFNFLLPNYWSVKIEDYNGTVNDSFRVTPIGLCTYWEPGKIRDIESYKGERYIEPGSITEYIGYFTFEGEVPPVEAQGAEALWALLNKQIKRMLECFSNRVESVDIDILEEAEEKIIELLSVLTELVISKTPDSYEKHETFHCIRSILGMLPKLTLRYEREKFKK